MPTGENETDLRKIIDMTRFASVLVLCLHIYFYCYGIFRRLGWRSALTDLILKNMSRTGIFSAPMNTRLIALGLLGISLLGANGKKDENINVKYIIWMLAGGMVTYLYNDWILALDGATAQVAIMYTIVLATGYLLILSSGIRLSRLIQINLNKDIFNEENQTFPQEERLLQNEYSINYIAHYHLNGKRRQSHINIINPFRGTLICATPGGGKSYFIILPMIRQMIEKGYGMFIYDFKYDDLSKPAYNWMLQYKKNYSKEPAFYTIDFDHLEYSHRCNPLYPQEMTDITDATEAAKSIIIGLNKSASKKQGDFFIESAINFLTAIIWYLRKYSNGEFCTLPHAIELLQIKYEDLFPVLNTQPEVQAHINDFIQSLEADVMEQLSGQVASLKVIIARISSPRLYWVLSANDFTLDINDPEHPKIICVGNNPQKQEAYAAPLSLLASRVTKIVNQKAKNKCGLIFDEAATIYVKLDGVIATGRSQKIATVISLQDISMLREDYGKDRADVLVNICGNFICGQVFGDTARMLAERFGKIIQTRESVSVGNGGTSKSRSTQLDYAIPASRIASLSSGEFVGMIADDPHNKIKLKMFHSEVQEDTKASNVTIKNLQDIPIVRTVTDQQISDNYYQIKQDIQNLIDQEIYKLKKEWEQFDDMED